MTVSIPFRLVQLRSGADLTLEEMAIKVGCTKGTLSKIENGKMRPSLELAKRLAELFNDEITRDELLYPELHTGKKPAHAVPTKKPASRATAQKEVR